MYTESFTVAAASLTGIASNVTGATFTIATPAAANDGLAHHITVRNDTANSHSGKTIALVGTDANDKVLTETITGPGTSATVTSTKAFKTLVSATPSATIGADTFDIGWAATAHSPWVPVNPVTQNFNASVAVLAGGTINYDVQHTYDVLNENAQAFNHATLAGKTATDYGNYTGPVKGVRVDVNSHTTGTFTFKVLQAGAT